MFQTNDELRAYFYKPRHGRGTILWISERNGNGILKVGHSETEVYFDRSVIKNFNDLKRGDYCSVIMELLEPDCLRVATSIVKLP